MKTVRLKYLFLLLISTLAITVSAQTGSISGRILDSKTGEELIGVSVQIEGTVTGAATDFEGKYTIANVKPGTYTLIVSYISYTKKSMAGIEVKAGEVASVNISLEESTKSLNEVVIQGEVKRETAAGLLIQQKNAASISDGISADAIRKTPDKTTSDVLKRVSGASIQDNKFAIIRGLNERYNAAYINGAPLPSSESDRKAFSFDIFPANLLDNITITKTATPDMPGEFAGGIIEINTKSVPDNNFQAIAIQGGYNSVTTFKNQLTYDGGKTDWLGIDDGTRAVPNGIPDDKGFPTLKNDQAKLGKLMKNDWAINQQKFTPNYGFQYTLGHVWGQKQAKLGAIFAATYSRTNVYQSIRRKEFDSNWDPSIPVVLTADYTDQNFSEQTLGGLMANLSYKINNNHQFTFKNLYSINSEDLVIQRNGSSSPLDVNPNLVQATAQWFTSNKIYTTQLGGTHYITGAKLKINWIGSYSDVDREIPNLRRSSYSRYTNLLNPDSPNKNDTTYKADVSNASVGPSYSGNRFYSTTKENIYSFKADVSHSFDIKSIKLKNTVKVGGLVQERNRNFDARQLGYITYGSGGVGSPNYKPFPDSVLYLPQDQIFDPKYMGNSSPTSGGFALTNNYKPTDSYSAESKLYAAFLMFDNRFRNDWRLIWGARIENFEQTLFTVLDNGTPLDVSTKKIDILPSINLVYSLTENQNLRASFSETVNRPEFRELAPFAFPNFSTRYVLSGNPNLSRALIKNYDLRYEWYPGRGQLFSVSGFYKDFTDPIEQKARYDVVREISYINVPSAKNYGVEFEFRFVVGTMLKVNEKSFLNDVTFFTNVTLIRSKVDVSGVAGSPISDRPLQGQSPYIINSGISYLNIKNGFSVSANYNKVGQRIYIVGSVNEPDIWENGRDVVDLQASKSFFKNKVELRFTLKDLLAQKVYFFQDNNHNQKFDASSDNQIWVANYGRTITMTATYKF
jgi:TonB-dependent receptor